MKHAAAWISLLLLPLAAQAQTRTPDPIHAIVTKVGHGLLSVKTESGQALSAAVTPATRIEVLTRKALADLKPGEFIGSGAMTDAKGGLHAQEVHIFAQPGIGEGHRQMGADPAHTMTNATVSKITPAVNGELITLNYAGGQQTITVAPDTPIVAMQPGTIADVKPGLPITMIGGPTVAGIMTLRAIMLGRDGSKPPL